MNGQYVISIPELTARVEAIFRKAGFSAEHADALSRVLVAGERDGCKSHGIYRVEGCLRTLQRGKVVPDAVPVVSDEEGAIVRVNAAGGFSNAAFEAGLPKLVERTRALGVAAMVVNDCTHFAALWPEIEAITENGLAALAMCPSYATVAPVGGCEPLLGTNPLAFGWPRADHPFVFDFATSVAARGEIELRRRAGESLPQGWALGPDGRPTENPEEALAGAMLPFGSHKGSAISTMIELLAGAMIGDLTSREALDWLGDTSLSPSHGELILAFDPARFANGREGSPEARAEMLFDAIVGQGARLPSQRRFAAREVAESNGIVLTTEENARLERLEREGLAAVS